MVSTMSEENFLTTLPDEILNKTIGFNQRDSTEAPERSFLELRLPSTDLNEIKGVLNKRYHFSSVRANFKKRVRRKGCPRNLGISNTKKRALGLFSIDRKGLVFKDLLPLHYCWVEYMQNMLNLEHLHKTGWKPDLGSSKYEDFTQLLWKADYHGAYISVTRSTCPSLVGIEGILVFESRNTVRLLGKDNETRCIPKTSCEFAIKIGNYDIKFIGKHFMVKPSERSVKKVKPGKYFEL